MTLRRTLMMISLLAAASGGAGIACGGLGVSSISMSDVSPGAGGAAGDPDASPPSGFVAPPADAGTTAPGTSWNGNPLCKVPGSGSGESSTCNPQDDNTVRANGADAKCRGILDAGTPMTADDGGDADGGAPPPDPMTYACHVQENIAGTEVAPVCLPEGSSTGPCAESQACKAGYECTGAQTGECRRYCCDPTACDATAFCDVQRIHGNGMDKVVVPVCMPIVACQLLTASQCASGQTCGVVDDASGLETASCVDVGTRTEGQDCETDHCAKDLACLGSQGSRKCFRLCETKGSATYGCAMGQTCKTNGVTFKDGNVGICSI